MSAPQAGVRVRRVRRPEAFGKVAVLHGGRSAEREVSLASGRACLAALCERGVDAHGVDPGDDVLEVLARGRFDRVFIALHGRGGEDGTLQGALEVAGIPYTGSGVLGSALAMDKRRTKLVWQALGLPTPDFRLVAGEGDLAAAARALGFPLAVKPVHEGSSIGVARATDEESLHSAWFEASRYDEQIIAEPWLAGAEYTAGILGREVLPVIRLAPTRAFYDYRAKYADDADTSYHCPCGLDADTEIRFRCLALDAFDAVGASGWGRVDLVCDAAGAPYLLDVNTAPGMTGHSLVPMAARAVGIEFADLVWEILETSVSA